MANPTKVMSPVQAQKQCPEYVTKINWTWGLGKKPFRSKANMLIKIKSLVPERHTNMIYPYSSIYTSIKENMV